MPRRPFVYVATARTAPTQAALTPTGARMVVVVAADRVDGGGIADLDELPHPDATIATATPARSRTCWVLIETAYCPIAHRRNEYPIDGSYGVTGRSDEMDWGARVAPARLATYTAPAASSPAANATSIVSIRIDQSAAAWAARTSAILKLLSI